LASLLDEVRHRHHLAVVTLTAQPAEERRFNISVSTDQFSHAMLAR